MTDVATRPIPAIAAAPRRAAVALALALVWAALVHWPTQNLWGVDDPFFLEAGRLWLTGAPPYLHAFDVKPPGFFAAVAAAEALFGATPAALSHLAALCDGGTAFCLWRIGAQLGAPRAGVFAAFGYPLLSLTLATNAGYPPLALATSLAFAIHVGAAPPTRRAALAGLAIGAAGMVKQTAVLEAMALIWAMSREPLDARTKAKALAAFALAAALPAVAFALYFAAQGALKPLLDDVIVHALQRPGLQNEGFADIFAHWRRALTPVAPLVALAIWAAAKASPRQRILGLWFGAAALELALQHARWITYLGPTLAPTLLLAGLVVASRPWLRMLAGALVAGLGMVSLVPQTYAGREAAVAAAGALVRAREPRAQDRLLAFGDGALLSTRLGLAPPTPYFHWMHLLCDFPGAGPDRLREAMDARPRFVVLPEPHTPEYCEAPGAYDRFAQTLGQDYRRLGEAKPLVVYERLDQR